MHGCYRNNIPSTLLLQSHTQNINQELVVKTLAYKPGSSGVELGIKLNKRHGFGDAQPLSELISSAEGDGFSVLFPHQHLPALFLTEDEFPVSGFI